MFLAQSFSTLLRIKEIKSNPIEYEGKIYSSIKECMKVMNLGYYSIMKKAIRL
jgi:hypothetical protein